MLIQCYLGPGEEAHTTVRGEKDTNFRQKYLFHLRKLCWQGTVQKDFVVVAKKLKSTLQKNGQSYWDTSTPPCLLREGNQSPPS